MTNLYHNVVEVEHGIFNMQLLQANGAWIRIAYGNLRTFYVLCGNNEIPVRLIMLHLLILAIMVFICIFHEISTH